MPYAMGYATIKAFAGEDALKMMTRTCGTTETPAGQKGRSPERHKDQPEKERKKRAGRNREPGEDEQNQHDPERNGGPDLEGQDHRTQPDSSIPPK